MEVIMSTKLFYSLALLLAFNGCLLTGYDVKTLMPFGKNAQEISNRIKLLAAQKVKISDALNQHFDQQEREITQKLLAKYNVTQAEWDGKIQQFNKLVARDPIYKKFTGILVHKPLDHAIIRKARQLLVDYNMNPEAISIVDSPNAGTAGVMTMVNNNSINYTLHLHIAELSSLSEAEYTAIIKHELMHLWYGDGIKTSVCFAPAFSQKFNPYDETLFLDYKKNAESRADVMGAISDSKDIAGFASVCAKYSVFDKFGNLDHPSWAQRAAALQQVSYYLQEEKKYMASAA